MAQFLPLATSLAAFLLSFICFVSSTSSFSTSSFNWQHVKPSKKLEYHDCYEGLQCARLLLPLDWQADEDELYNETVAIAIVKLPALVPPTDPAYGGPIFFNPGGPGGSGVELVRVAGRILQWAVDSLSFGSSGKSFDILSFDPRGVLYSTPHALCFADRSARDIWHIQGNTDGVLDSSPLAVTTHMARGKVLGAMCAARESPLYYEPEKIRAYMSTASVARDMLEMVERIEELRQETTRATSANHNFQSPITGQEAADQRPGLQYIGFSYGTFLGSTFASMYPNRVKRMVLDGVVHASDYSSAAWLSNLQDTEKTVQYFYQTCFDAGPARCPLYNKGGPIAMENAVKSTLTHLRDHPIPAIVQPDDTTEVSSGLITYSDVKALIFRALYEPITKFPALATILAGLQTGNYREILGLLASEMSQQCALPDPNGEDRGAADDIDEVPTAIVCSDGDDITARTPAEFQSYLNMLESQSPTIGSIWGMIGLRCIGWPVRPKWRFTGPFGANTSVPILWIGNTADPVTPLGNAHEMAKGFPGSVVLTQDSAGHCSISAPSMCTIGMVRVYFRDGAVPREGTVCPADLKPFQGFDGRMEAMVKERGEAFGGLFDMLARRRWGKLRGKFPRS